MRRGSTVVTLLRFRWIKKVGAATVGILSSATTTVMVVVSLFSLVALGYWDPPVGRMIGDAVGAGRAVWSLAGEWLVDQTMERFGNIVVG